MLLLAFDTATPAVTVALHDGDEVVAQSLAVDARRHGELLAPGIEQVLGQARGACPATSRTSRSAPARGRSPACGSAWSPRSPWRRRSASAAHGLCTLDALALRAVQEDAVVPEGDFLVATDARRREVYWAAYEQRPDGSVGAVPQRVHGPAVSRPDDVPVAGRPVVGRGADLYPDHLGLSVGPIDPSAAALAHLAVAAAGHRRRPERPDPAVPAPSGRARGRSAQDRPVMSQPPGQARPPDALVGRRAPAAAGGRALRPRGLERRDVLGRARRVRAVGAAGLRGAGDGLDGYAGVSVAGGVADVMTVAVAPSRQGQGLGRFLVQQLVALAAARGAGRMMLEVRGGQRCGATGVRQRRVRADRRPARLLPDAGRARGRLGDAAAASLDG